MAKKVKMSKVEIIDKVIESLNILVLPVCAVVALWSGLDLSVYIAGGVELVNSALSYWKLYLVKKAK